MVLLPETIGSIAYISKFKNEMKKNIICGFNLTCVGDERAYTIISSPEGNTLADDALKSSLFGKKNMKIYCLFFLENFENSLTKIIGESLAAINTESGWVGSLEEIEPTSGYWMYFSELEPSALTIGIPVDENLLYELHYGNNLISYAPSHAQSIENALPDDIEPHFNSIMGESVAAVQIGGEWVGVLENTNLK